MRPTAVTTSANTTGHCSTSQVHLKTGPSPSVFASRLASVGPAMTRNMEAMMNTAMPTVSATAVSRVFHHGLDSVTSYAAFKVVIIELMAPELDHTAIRKANVSTPPLFCLPSEPITSPMISTTACGANLVKMSTTLPVIVCR